LEEEETQKPLRDSVKPKTKKPAQSKLPEFCSTVSSSIRSLLLCRPKQEEAIFPPTPLNNPKTSPNQPYPYVQ
jgi:hypothetical protein